MHSHQGQACFVGISIQGRELPNSSLRPLPAKDRPAESHLATSKLNLTHVSSDLESRKGTEHQDQSKDRNRAVNLTEEWKGRGDRTLEPGPRNEGGPKIAGAQ